MLEDHPDESAVSYDCNPFSFMFQEDFLEEVPRSFQEVEAAFTLLDPMVRSAISESFEIIWVADLDFLGSQAFENTEVLFAQTLIETDLVSVSTDEGLGGSPRTDQITAVDQIQLCIPEALP